MYVGEFALSLHSLLAKILGVLLLFARHRVYKFFELFIHRFCVLLFHSNDRSHVTE